MIPWRILGRVHALFLALVMGCSTVPKSARVENTGHGKAVIHLPRTAEMQPVEMEEEEAHQAMRQLARQVRWTGTPRQTAEKPFQMDPQSGNYFFLQPENKLVPLGPEPLEGTLTKEDLELAERYRLW